MNRLAVACFRRRLIVPPALFLLCLGASGAACAPTPPDDLSAFPGQAAQVVASGDALVRAAGGFERAERIPGEKAHVTFPFSAVDPVVFRTAWGDLRVWEKGLSGEGQSDGRVVSYRRAGGTSYWSDVRGAAEEWLSFEAGHVRDGAPAAVWEIAGGTPAEYGQYVLVTLGDGKHRVRVTAPAAFFPDGTNAPVRLAVRGNTVELYVEAGGNAVLVDPVWNLVTGMNEARLGHVAAKLTNGQVLVAGGQGPFDQSLPSSEIYDEVNDVWNPLPDMNSWRFEHAIATQPLGPDADGAALTMGGLDFGFPLSTTDLFDGFGWQGKPNMFTARAGHTATRMNDDTVLVVGGYNDCGGSGVFLASAGPPVDNGLPSFCSLCEAEYYDATAGSGFGDWIGTSPLFDCRAYHTATRLPDGKVLIAGGYNGSSALSSAEIYDQGAFNPVLPMLGERHHHTATLLPNGKVMIAGGYNGLGDAVSSVEVYDPVTGLWSAVDDLAFSRAQHTATLQPDGTVLFAGGYTLGGATVASEIFTPTAPAGSQSAVTADMNSAHAAHIAALLDTGRTLVAGGDDFNGDPPITNVTEIFGPGSLGAPCLNATDCLSGFCTDGVCCDTACNGVCESCNQQIIFPDSKNKDSNSWATGTTTLGSSGICQPVAAGDDPDEECALDPQDTCGSIGTCNGSGACETYPADTICKVPVCNGDVLEGGGLCDGAGTCVSEADLDCAPYQCQTGTCLSTCDTDPDCSIFAYCGATHVCSPKKTNGTTASSPAQCLSGIVTDGVCCDTTCGGPCEACNLAGSEGTCSPLSGFACDDGNACTQVDVCQNGVCVGGSPVMCPGEVGCSGGKVCDTKTGQCSVSTPPKKDGDPCEDGDLCTAGETCTAGVCNGMEIACTPEECQSGGECIDGLCNFETLPNYTACTPSTNPCQIGWCYEGGCIPNNVPDGTGCKINDEGGVCIAGECVPDSLLGGTGGGGSGEGGSGAGMSGTGGDGAGHGSGANDAGGNGGSGNGTSNGNNAPNKLLGNGLCSAAAPGAPSGTSPLTWMGLFASIGAVAAHRRRKFQRASK